MSEFHIATPEGPELVDGFVWKFVGIHSVAPDQWSVTHIPSGHRVGAIQASFGTAKLLLVELASRADWGFSEMKAWREADPHLPQKVLDFQAEFEEFSIASGKGGNPRIASEIAMLNVSHLPTPEG